MAAYMQYTAAFVQQIDAVQHFPAEDIHFPVERQRWEFFAGFYIMLHFFEYPGRPKLARPIMMASTP